MRIPRLIQRIRSLRSERAKEHFSPEISEYSRTKVQGCPNDSHTRLQVVPCTAAIEVLS
jgi:hypothetical protein